MIVAPDVNTLMENGLSDWLNSQADARAKAKEKFYWTGGGGIVVGLLVAVILLILGAQQFAMFAGIFIAGAFIAWAMHIRQQMINALKQGMNGAIAASLGIEYSVTAFSGNEFELAKQFRLVPGYDDAYFEDQWHGAINGTDFLMYEAKLTEERGSGKSRRTVTVFQGIVLRFQFARPFLGTTLIRREGFKFTLFGDDKSFDGVTLERLNMVDPRFEAEFDIYGNDPVEGRYLLHPAYCERLLALEQEMRGAKLSALFSQGDLIVTMHTDKMFESASLSAEEDRTGLARTITQFASITQLIQLLNERPRG